MTRKYFDCKEISKFDVCFFEFDSQNFRRVFKTGFYLSRIISATFFWEKHSIGLFQTCCWNFFSSPQSNFGQAVKTGFYLSRTFSVILFWRKTNFIENFQNFCENLLSLLEKFIGRAVKTEFYLSRTFSVFFLEKKQLFKKIFRTCSKSFGPFWETCSPKLSKLDSTSLDNYFDSKKTKMNWLFSDFKKKFFAETIRPLLERFLTKLSKLDITCQNSFCEVFGVFYFF